MMRAIIVDDECYARKALAMKLKDCCGDVSVLALADSAVSAMEAIRTYRPNLVFLDIEMPGDGGFVLLETLGAFDFSVIFVTAFEQHALRAIKHSALDYLIKPVDPLELQVAVNKARSVHDTRLRADNTHSAIEGANADAPGEHLVLPTENGFEFVRIADVLRCHATSNYTRIYLLNGETILVSRTLGEFEEMLRAHNFFRIHVSHLINLQCIKRYHKGRGGSKCKA